MLRLCLVVYVVSIFVIGYWCDKAFVQERAVLKYANPKYLKDVVVFTGRKSRRDPYLSNVTGTLLVPYGDNVTARIILNMASGGDFKIVAKLCESFKYKWMNEYTRKFTNVSIDKCPLQPGRYMYMNMELPPRNFPFPIAEGDSSMSLELYVTATKEPILDVRASLRYDKNKKSSKKTKKG